MAVNRQQSQEFLCWPLWMLSWKVKAITRVQRSLCYLQYFINTFCKYFWQICVIHTFNFHLSSHKWWQCRRNSRINWGNLVDNERFLCIGTIFNLIKYTWPQILIKFKENLILLEYLVDHYKSDLDLDNYTSWSLTGIKQ